MDVCARPNTMKKILIAIVAVVLLLVIGGVVTLTLTLGSIVKKGVETVGPQITKTEMKLDGANISVFSGSGALKGFFLGNPDGYKTPSAVKVGEVALGVNPRSVFSDKVRVTHVRVQGAEITFEGTLGTANNLSKILDNVNAMAGGSKGAETNKTPPAPTPSTTPARAPAEQSGASRKLQVDDFLITGAKVHVSMTMLAGRSLTLPLPEIHFTDLGTGPEGITAAELTQRVLNEVTVATLKAVQQGVGDLSKTANEAVKNASQMATNSLKDAKAIEELFKKKK